MDTSGDSIHNGNGNGSPKPDHPKVAPLTSETGPVHGAPVESPIADGSAGAPPIPPEPLVVPDDDEPAPRPIKLRPIQRKFLAAVSKTGNITAAAKLAKNARKDHYEWIGEKDENGAATPRALVYRAAFEEAMDEAIELLEKEARRRAEKGTLKPVFHQGEECGAIREYSDTLLIFLLKGARPEKYRDRYEHVGAGGKPLHPDKVTVDVSVNYAEALKSLTDDELEAHNAIAEKLLARSSGSIPPGKN